jgi:hypothetical protein
VRACAAGDPAAQNALALPAARLADRFSGDIALGMGRVAAGGATDIALGEDQKE